MQQNSWLGFAPGSDGGLDTVRDLAIFLAPKVSPHELDEIESGKLHVGVSVTESASNTSAQSR